MNKDVYKQLIHDTKTYIRDELSEQTFTTTSKENYDYFKTVAQNSKMAKPVLPKKTPAEPVVKPSKIPEKNPTKVVNEPVEENQNVPFEKKKIALELLPPLKHYDLNEQISTIRATCPNIQIIDTIPSPSDNSNYNDSSEVCMFVYKESEKNIHFLQKVLKALKDRKLEVSFHHFDSEENLVSYLNQISSKKLFIFPRKLLELFPFMHKLHDKKSNQLHQTFCGSPVIMLEEINLYENDHYLKKVLWEGLRYRLNI